MKKNILKKLLLFGFILFQFGCNLEEEFVTERNHQQNIKIRYLYGKEALKKGKNLEAKMMTSNKINVLSRTNISLSTNEGVVDYTKVLEVIDENNIINYTFAIKNHPDDSETVFHNLVLSNENSNDEEILLLRYESETPNTSIINFIGTITTKSISSATNPCDTSTSDADFTGATGSDNGSANYISGGNNVVVEPPNSGGSVGGSVGNTGGNSLSDVASFVCNSNGCSFTTTSVTAMQGHYAPQGFTLVHRINNTSSTTTNPCDPNGNIGIINDSVVKTPCDELKKISNAVNVKSSLTTLKTKTQGQKEFGYATKKSATNSSEFETPEEMTQNPLNESTLEINNYLSGEYVGISHNHTAKGVPMFSGFDLTQGLFGLASFAQSLNFNLFPQKETNFEEFYFSLASYDVHSGKNFTFALKIENWDSLANFMSNGGKEKLDLNLRQNYQKLYDEAASNNPNLPIPTIDNLKISFLSSLADLNVGVGLYEASSDLNDWSKVKYDATTNLLTNIPCNN